MEELNKVSISYRSQLQKALDNSDAEETNKLVGILAKEYTMMQRTIQRILSIIFPLALAETTSVQEELIEKLKQAVNTDGDFESAKKYFEEMKLNHQFFHDTYMHWFAEISSKIHEKCGEEALFRVLKQSGQEFKPDFQKWAELSKEELVKASSWLQLSHPHGWLNIEEDDDKYTLHQGCGTGGRLIEHGFFEQGGKYARSNKAENYSLGKELVPTYCLHCTVWNTLLTTEWFGYPLWVIEHPLNSSCTVYIYKDPAKIPKDYIKRLGLLERFEEFLRNREE